MEKNRLTLGFVPLTDCAVLVMAKEKGFFARHGLDVTLSREASWANIRDKVATGALDGAQMLAAMPLAATLEIDAVKTPMLTAFSMDLNGNGITVSRSLFERLRSWGAGVGEERPFSARALKALLDHERSKGRAPLTFAQVFPYSTHNYEIRYWLAAAGVDPDRDLRLIVIPPPQMVDQLKSGNVDGYCVGEPWNEVAVHDGSGRALITSYEIWNNCPEKVFGVTQGWAARYPETHRALLRALIETAQWIDRPDNRMEVVDTIARPQYVDAPPEIVKMSMLGSFSYAADEEPRPLPDFNVFFRYAANFPWRSHADWFITQMYRWGQIRESHAIAAISDQVYRPDLYREAAADLGISCPLTDRKTEGRHGENWTMPGTSGELTMGPDRFLDGRVFDPQDPIGYLEGFEIRNLTVDIERLREANTR